MNKPMLTLPKKPDYGFAYFIVYLMYFVSLVLFFVGLSMASPALNGSNNIYQNTLTLYSGIFGSAIIISSIFILAAAQITKAILDAALFSWHTMVFTSKLNGVTENQILENDLDN
jgi:hypothetical protein